MSKKDKQQLYTEKFTMAKQLECMKDRLSWGAYKSPWCQLMNGLLFDVSLAIRSFSNVLTENRN